MFVEISAAFRDGKLAESLIFVVRDTPDWDEEGAFLERVWAQNENSSDLREVSSSLRRHFPEIECFCTPRASDNVRLANQLLEVQEQDFPLLRCLARIKCSVIEKCKNFQGKEIEDKIDLAQKIVDYLQYEAPELKTTAVLSKEATVAVAVNKCSEIFRKALKNSSPETLQIAETMARKEIDQRLNELLKAGNIPEAKNLLESQIQEILSEKRLDFKNVENDKEIRRKSDEFCAKLKTNIQKLSKLDEALEMRRTGRVREEIGEAGIELLETSIQMLENFLQNRITYLKAQFVQTTLNEMNSEMRETLAKIEIQTIPDQKWLESQVDLRMKAFEENCFRHEICNDEWEKVEPEAMKMFMTTASNALVIIKMKIEAKEKEMALQREIDVRKDEIEREKRRKLEESALKAMQEERKNDQPTISASPDYSAAEKLVKDELKVFEIVVKRTSIDQSRFKAFLKREMNQTLKNLIVKYKKQQLPERDLKKFKDLLLKDGLRFVRVYFRIELTANEIENPIERVISFTEEERKVLKNQAEKSRGWMMGKELDYQVVQRQFAHQQRQDFEKVTNLNRATLEILIENSNSRRTFFLQTLVKNGYDQELKNGLNRSLAEEWMMFFKRVPRNDLCFEEMQDFAYKVAHRLWIQFPPSLMQYLAENFQRSVRHHQNVPFQHGPLGHQGQNPAQHQFQKWSYNIEHYDGADQTMMTVGNEHARKKFFEEIKKRRERSLVETKFDQDKTPSVTELVKRETKIFNTKSQIDAQDLDALNMFIAFSQRTEERVGQHFMIMVRDSIASGFDPEYLEQMRVNARRVPELARLLNGVFEAFEKVECCMVPRPSNEVINASREILAKDCGDDFLSMLCECANHVLRNLVPKIVMGTPLTGRTLGAYVENLVDHIHSNSHKAICSAFAATSQLFFEKARIAGNETFAGLHEMLVREHGHRPIRPRDYEEALQNFIQQAIEAYKSSQLFGSAEEKSKHFDDFRKLLEERGQEKVSSNKDRYRDIQMAEAVNGAYEVYEKGMRPDFVESLEKNKKAEFVRDRHKKTFPEAMKHFENVVQDFLDEPDLIEYKRNLLNEMIQARYEDLQQDNAIRHLHQQVDEMFQGLVEEHWKALKERVATIKDESEIEEAIDACENLLRGKYGIKKAEFVADVAIALPKISPEMVERLLDNFREIQLVQFKRCEDSFEMEVRHNLKVGALNKQMEDLHLKQAEDKKRLESLEEETNAQIGGMNEQLVEERRLRVEAESGGSNVQAILAMMKAMNENSEAQMEQMRHERDERIAREERDRQERERRYETDMEMMRMEQQERARRYEAEDQKRREDIRKQQQAMECQRQGHEAKMAAIRNRPPPPQPKICSIM
ncbi:unnamed protein product, partial [Mesorhabditis belari]|uniref:Uncharacterized protein n=1 Tax=Mesorhabditis belari TaxID=2138241 RepID=A0AAF3FBZ9_9BILA